MTFYTSPDRFPLYHLNAHIQRRQPAFSRLNYFNTDHQKNPKTLLQYVPLTQCQAWFTFLGVIDHGISRGSKIKLCLATALGHLAELNCTLEYATYSEYKTQKYQGRAQLDASFLLTTIHYTTGPLQVAGAETHQWSYAAVSLCTTILTHQARHGLWHHSGVML